MSTTCRRRSNRVASALPVPVASTSPSNAGRRRRSNQASTSSQPAQPLINNFVTNPWLAMPRESHDQPFLDPAILRPVLDHIDRKSLATITRLSKAFKNDDAILSQMRYFCNARNQVIFAGLIAFFNVMHKFLEARPSRENFGLFIATKNPVGASIPERWSWVLQENAYVKISPNNGGMFRFERPLQPGFTMMSLNVLQRNLPNWFRTHVGDANLCKIKPIYIYMHLGDIGYRLALAFWLRGQIPSLSYTYNNEILEIVIPFHDSSTFPPQPISYIESALLRQPMWRLPRMQTLGSGVLEGDRRVRSIIDSVPYVSTSAAQHLLSKGDLDKHTTKNRNRTIHSIAEFKRNRGGGNKKITGKSRAAASASHGTRRRAAGPPAPRSRRG